MRGIPIFTFVNKMDRQGKDPFALMEEIEQVLGIRSCPINWPIGMGSDFRGVYDRQAQHVELFDGGDHGQKRATSQTSGPDDPRLRDLIGEELGAKLREDIELLDIAGDPWDLERFLKGELTPVFWGSAMTNFGVRPFLETFLALSPPPVARTSDKGHVEPASPHFSGFIFKIQANMNPAHRDRIAFLRICSGKFERGMAVKHVRLGKEIKLSQPQQFMAQERTIIEEAYAGDIIGLFDPGIFHIGDTLCTGERIQYQGIPSFSPEHFARVGIRDTLKSKHFQKGIQQLTEEGAIQVFAPVQSGNQDPILGAVGELQFEVFQHRMKHEYGVDVELTRLPYELARWVEGDFYQARAFFGTDNLPVTDRDGRPVLLFRNEWSMLYVVQQRDTLTFKEIASTE